MARSSTRKRRLRHRSRRVLVDDVHLERQHGHRVFSTSAKRSVARRTHQSRQVHPRRGSLGSLTAACARIGCWPRSPSSKPVRRVNSKHTEKAQAELARGDADAAMGDYAQASTTTRGVGVHRPTAPRAVALPEGGLRLLFSSFDPRAHEIQASTDTVHWITSVNHAQCGGPRHIRPHEYQPAPACFFRVVEP